MPDVWGRVWQYHHGAPPHGWTRLVGATELERRLRDAPPLSNNPLTTEELCECVEQAGISEVSESHYDEDGGCWVPLCVPGSYARAVLSAEELNGLGLSGRLSGLSSVTVTAPDGTERHFRADAGRTWRECDASAIDTIYVCQRFGVEDRFMLYALKGRTFFFVGEFDTYEITLFLEGIGGCGKSTIMKGQMEFWPHHLKGIQSSNMQSQFGMSSTAVNKSGGYTSIVINSEVNDDLQIPQEEWQQAVSGEWVSLAVKHKEPLIMKWIAPFLWSGNRGPGIKNKWNNQQGQVSRRLAGVKMEFPVQPRDGNIMRKIKKTLGQLQRKQILAYFEFVRVHGSTDPMSVPTKLPPAFASFYSKFRQATDPMEHFLSEGTFVKQEEGKTMLMSEFKELYQQYRIQFDLGKALRWSEDTYRTPFNERGIKVERMERYTDDAGEEHRNVDVICHLSAVGHR